MSRSIRSPIRMPASKRSATMSVRASLKDKSREISGYCARNRGIAEPRKKSAAGGGAVRRNRPAGLPRNSFADSSADWYWSSTGRSRLRRRSPAAVGATDRVVRSTSRTPRRSSRLRTISLTRGGDKASCLAALVKLFSSTTATKAVVSARLGACIGMPIIRKTGIAHEDYCRLSITPARVSLVEREQATNWRGGHVAIFGGLLHVAGPGTGPLALQRE